MMGTVRRDDQNKIPFSSAMTNRAADQGALGTGRACCICSQLMGKRPEEAASGPACWKKAWPGSFTDAAESRHQLPGRWPAKAGDIRVPVHALGVSSP